MKFNKGDKVKLINPGGYDNYQGKIISSWNVPGWWVIDWDSPYPPCTSPMEEKHLVKMVDF